MKYFIAACVLINFASATEFANQLRKCRTLRGAQLDSCLENIMEFIRPRLKTGIPELNVPVLDPLQLQNINFSQHHGDINIDADFKDVIVKGVSSYATRYIRADPATLKLFVGLDIKRLLVNGQYNLGGNLFLLNIEGQGPFFSVLENISADAVGTIVPDRVNDKLGITGVTVKFTIGEMKTRLKNLFNGDPLLGETMNHFINENGQEIFKEIEPEVARQINFLVTTVLGEAFANLPVDSIIV